MMSADSSAHAAKRRFPLGNRRLVVVALAIAILVIVLVRGFLVDVFYIPSGSMEPTLEQGDRVAVWRVGAGDPHRGDVVVFDGSGSLWPNDSGANPLTRFVDEVGSWAGMSQRDGIYVKRVIGVAGDHVQCCGTDGKVTVNGQPLDESYVMPGDKPSETPFDVVVPEGRMWVMGDHRSDSRDSRALIGAPGGGLIRTDKIVGRPVAVLWPFESIHRIRR